jgi:hypothetical protein
MARIQFRREVKSWIRIRIETNADQKLWINLYLSFDLLNMIMISALHVDHGYMPIQIQLKVRG